MFSSLFSTDILKPIYLSKRRKVDKGGKGLRHFSMKVCEKVQKKGTTTYNEVADELVAEFTDPSRCTSPADQVSFFQFNRFIFEWNLIVLSLYHYSSMTKKISGVEFMMP